MSESMIEQVALAINKAGMAWLNENDPKRLQFVWADIPDEVFARAAIDAIRFPTKYMVLAGLNCDAWANAEGSAVEMLSGTFTAMIDEALKEPKP